MEGCAKPARELGAEVFATTDDDLVRGLLRIGRQQNATQIIVGKPVGTGWLEWWRGDRMLKRLARESGDIDLQVVRAEKSSGNSGRVWLPVLASSFQQYLFATVVVAGTGLLNLGLMALSGPRVPDESSRRAWVLAHASCSCAESGIESELNGEMPAAPSAIRCRASSHS